MRALIGVVNVDAVFGRSVAPRVLGRMSAEQTVSDVPPAPHDGGTRPAARS